MKVEVTQVSKSQKGTIWVMVRVLEGATPEKGDVFNCEKKKESHEEVCGTEEQVTQGQEPQ